MQAPSLSLFHWARASAGGGRGKAGPRLGAREGGTLEVGPRSPGMRPAGGREARGGPGPVGDASRLLGQEPFPLSRSWAVGETRLPGRQTGRPVTGQCGLEDPHTDGPVGLRPRVSDTLVRAASASRARPAVCSLPGVCLFVAPRQFPSGSLGRPMLLTKQPAGWRGSQRPALGRAGPLSMRLSPPHGCARSAAGMVCIPRSRPLLGHPGTVAPADRTPPHKP